MSQYIPLALTSRRSLANTTVEMLQSHVLKVALPILFAIIFSISVPLNSISLYFLCRYSRPWTPIIIFSINLAISDLLYSTILPFQIIYHMKKNDWPFGEPLCRIITVLFYGNMHGCMLTMMSISIERYIGIVHPLRYKVMRPIRTTVVTCVIIWVLVFLSLIPLMTNKLTFHVKELSILTCFDVLPKEMFRTRTEFIIYFGCLMLFFLLLPLLVMGFCYISIIRTLLHSSSTELRESKKQTVYLIIVLLLVLSVCYMPHIVIAVLHYVLTFQGGSAYVAYKLAVAIHGFNCCADPFVYYFGSKEFRRKIEKKLCRCVADGFSENTPIFSEHDMKIIPVPKEQ